MTKCKVSKRCQNCIAFLESTYPEMQRQKHITRVYECQSSTSIYRVDIKHQTETVLLKFEIKHQPELYMVDV